MKLKILYNSNNYCFDVFNIIRNFNCFNLPKASPYLLLYDLLLNDFDKNEWGE